VEDARQLGAIANGFVRLGPYTPELGDARHIVVDRRRDVAGVGPFARLSPTPDSATITGRPYRSQHQLVAPRRYGSFPASMCAGSRPVHSPHWSESKASDGQRVRLRAGQRELGGAGGGALPLTTHESNLVLEAKGLAATVLG
jgi:hypothetical protein